MAYYAKTRIFASIEFLKFDYTPYNFFWPAGTFGTWSSLVCIDRRRGKKTNEIWTRQVMDFSTFSSTSVLNQLDSKSDHLILKFIRVLLPFAQCVRI